MTRLTQTTSNCFARVVPWGLAITMGCLGGAALAQTEGQPNRLQQLLQKALKDKSSSQAGQAPAGPSQTTGAAGDNSVASGANAKLPMCKSASAAPLKSKLDLRGVFLGDPCQLDSASLSRQITGWVRFGQNGADDSYSGSLARGLDKAADVAVREAAKAGQPSEATLRYTFAGEDTQYVATVAAAPLDVPSTPRNVVPMITASVCGADTANNLAAGNSFRNALESKYGSPTSTITVRDYVKQEQARLAALQENAKKARVQEQQMMLSALYPAIVEAKAEWAELRRQRGDDGLVALEWASDDGAILRVQHATSGCDAQRPSFNMRLAIAGNDNFITRGWILPVIGALQADKNRRQASGPVPKL